MVYTKTGPFSDGAAPYLSAAFFNKIEQSLTDATTVIAPPPSGDTTGVADQAALQPLLTAAQATSGTLVLQAGTYHVTGLATASSFTQPRIVGQGRDQTIVQGTTASSPIIRFKGGSGRLSGGYLADFTILANPSGGGIGLQIADAGGVRWARLKFDGALAEGIQFCNEAAGSFCEYNSGDAYFKGTVVLPVHYVRLSGNESFHGTGLTHGTLIEQSTTATSPMILIDPGAFVYGAPLDIAVFPSAPNVSIIRNLNMGRIASFHGHLDIETGSAGTNVSVADPAQNTVLYMGTMGGLASGTGLVMGACRLADKTYYSGANQQTIYRQYQQAFPVTATTMTLTTQKTGVAFAQVDIRQGGNYYRSYLLHLWPNVYGTNGTVTILANPESLDVNTVGAPTFTISNSQLVATNSNFPTDGSMVAYVTILPLNINQSVDAFEQR